MTAKVAVLFRTSLCYWCAAKVTRTGKFALVVTDEADQARVYHLCNDCGEREILNERMMVNG